MPPRQRGHPARQPAGDARRIRLRAHREGAEEPARPRGGGGEIAQGRRQRLVPHVRGSEPAPVEVNAFHQLVHLEDQLAPWGRAHNGAIVARPGQNTRTVGARIAPQPERGQERVDEPQLVHKDQMLTAETRRARRISFSNPKLRDLRASAVICSYLRAAQRRLRHRDGRSL